MVRTVALVVALTGPSCDKSEDAQPKSEGAKQVDAAPADDAPAEDPTTKDSEPEEPKAVEVQIAAREPPEVTVTAAGRNPREELVLAPKAGTTEGLEIVTKTRMAMRGKGTSLPPTGVPAIVLRGKATIQSVEGSEIAFVHEVDTVEVRDDADAPPDLVKDLRSQLVEFASYRAELVADSKGGLRSGKVYMPQTATPAVNQLMNQITESFGQIQVPLPKEPVGVGAKWRATVTIDQAGLKVEQVVEYELKKRDGDTLEIDASLEQKLLEESFAPPGGLPAKITAFDSTGSGSMRLDLAHLVPAKSDLTLRVDMTLEADGSPHKMAMVISVSFART